MKTYKIAYLNRKDAMDWFCGANTLFNFTYVYIEAENEKQAKEDAKYIYKRKEVIYVEEVED